MAKQVIADCAGDSRPLAGGRLNLDAAINHRAIGQALRNCRRPRLLRAQFTVGGRELLLCHITNVAHQPPAHKGGNDATSQG
jgi:hypothetical protein